MEHAPFDTWTTRWEARSGVEQPGQQRLELERAWEIAEALARSNPYYADRVHLPTGRTAADFRQLPTTTKSDVVADCETTPPYGRRTVAPPSDIRHVVETSGTSGKGREVYVLNEHDEGAIFRAEAVGFWWAGARPGTTVLLTLPIGVTAAGLWYYGGLRKIGANVLSVGAYTTDRKVELLIRYRAEMIVGTPSYVERLASVCDRKGTDPRSLGVRSLVIAGEPYSDAWAEMIQERWGALLYEQYGCTERIMGWTCPGGVLKDGRLGTLHVPSGLAYWEVVDPETQLPADNEEWGEMIATPLTATASPLLRFATRDRVQFVAAGSCPCGRPLAGIRAGGVQRYDDMLKLRGLNVWPVSFDEAVFAVSGVTDYRGTVRRGDDGTEIVEIRVECDSDAPTTGILQEVAQGVRRHVGLTVEVLPAEPGELSAGVPTGFVKVSRWRDERREFLAAGGGAIGTEPRPFEQGAR